MGCCTFIIFVGDFGSSFFFYYFWLQFLLLLPLNLLGRQLFFMHLLWQKVALIYPCCMLIISTFFLCIMLLLLFQHLLVRQTHKVISQFKFILNLIPKLIFAMYFIERDMYAVLSLLGKSQMDPWFPVSW